MGFILSLFVMLMISAPPALSCDPFTRKSGEAPYIVAHGGCKHLFPENTMVAFDGAVALGVDMLEMDVCLTSDSVLVTHHDASLERTSDGSGLIGEYDFATLKNFNFGAKFPGLDKSYPYRSRKVGIATCEEVLLKYGREKRMLIEIKPVGADGRRCADQLAELLRNTGLEQSVLVSSFDDEIVRYFRSVSGNRVATAMGQRHARCFVLLSKLGLGFLWRGHDRSLQLPLRSGRWHLDCKSIVRSAHRQGISVYYWTVNDGKTMLRLQRLGADGIITDRPDRVPKEFFRTLSD